MEGLNEALDAYKRLLPNDVRITTTVIDPSWRDAIEQEAVTFGQRFVINGCSATKGSRTSIELSLGNGFGDGRHSTTQACVNAMETLWASNFSPQTVLDLGTGSGILALAAAHLGRTVTAVDRSGSIGVCAPRINQRAQPPHRCYRRGPSQRPL